jgi:uncharacterized Zn finger protein (UPF0148 family)
MNKCCESIREGVAWPRYHACGRSAKVERDGKWYCGIHDPVKRAEKAAVQHAKWMAELEASTKKRKLDRAAPELYEVLKAVVAFWDAITMEDRVKDIHDKARAALAKVES